MYTQWVNIKINISLPSNLCYIYMCTRVFFTLVFCHHDSHIKYGGIGVVVLRTPFVYCVCVDVFV